MTNFCARGCWLPELQVVLGESDEHLQEVDVAAEHAARDLLEALQQHVAAGAVLGAQRDADLREQAAGDDGRAAVARHRDQHRQQPVAMGHGRRGVLGDVGQHAGDRGQLAREFRRR